MSYLPAINTLWAHAAYPSTRARSRSASPELTSAGPSQHNNGHQQPGNQQLSPVRQATLRRRLIRQATRGDHLPARSKCAEQARMLRYLKGYPPIGSSAEADQLSDLEESIEVGKHHAIRFGERYIVQIGRRRTMREEELSNEEDEGRRPHATALDGSAADGAAHGQDESSMSDSEGGPGPFIGGHTGHAQAESQQQIQAAMQAAMQAQRRARDAEAEANRAAAAATAARNQAARQAAIQLEEDAVDLDADIEDLDDDHDQVDFD